MARLGFLLALWLAGGACAAHSATLDFSFRFENTANGGGTVEGIVRGLATSGFSAASSVEVTANTLGFGLGEYNGSPLVNEFTVSNGAVGLFNFAAVGSQNQVPAVTCCSISLEGFAGGEVSAGLVDNFDAAPTAFDTGIVFTALPSPAPVPLPPPGLLIVAALLGLAAVGSWRRTAPAAQDVRTPAA